MELFEKNVSVFGGTQCILSLYVILSSHMAAILKKIGGYINNKIEKNYVN